MFTNDSRRSATSGRRSLSRPCEYKYPDSWEHPLAPKAKTFARRGRPKKKHSAAVKRPYWALETQDKDACIEEIQSAYNEWREGDVLAYRRFPSSLFVVGRSFFTKVEETQVKMDSKIIDLWLASIRRLISKGERLLKDVNAVSTIVVNIDFFAVHMEESRLNSSNPKTKKFDPYADFTWWTPPKGMVYTAMRWRWATLVITICLVKANHLVTVCIYLDDWKIKLYDSMRHSGVQDYSSTRMTTLIPLNKFLYKLLEHAGVWEHNYGKRTCPHSRDCPIRLGPVPHFIQFD